MSGPAGWYSHPIAHLGDGRLRNGRTRLSEDDIAAIRGHFAARATCQEIADAFDVHRSRVWQLTRDMDNPRRLRPSR